MRAPLLGCAKSHFRAPTARNRTSAPVSGGTLLKYCHLTLIMPWLTSMTYNRGSLGATGGEGNFSSPMQAGLLIADSQHQRLLMRKDTMASYSMPSSRPAATVSLAGAGMAPPVHRYQFWLPTRRSFTIVCFASSGRVHFTLILPSPCGTITGTSVAALSWITICMPPISPLASMLATLSLAMEYSPKPSALRQQISAEYSTQSCTPLMFTSVRLAAKVVRPEMTKEPLPSTSIFFPVPTSVSCTWVASTGGDTLGTAQETLSLPLPSAVRVGAVGFGGFSRGFSSIP